jgi:hypothetical protein
VIEVYFFDVPVYRLPEDRYYTERSAFVERLMRPIGDTQLDAEFRGHLEQMYGGPWQFNEIIGYIRLFFLGSQVRGEYWGVQRKRFVRTRKKTMLWLEQKLVPEMEIPSNASSAETLKIISEYLRRCKAHLKGRVVDDSLFATLGPFVNWNALIASARQGDS